MTEITDGEAIGISCPVCGCQLGESPYKEGEVYYCCEACADGNGDGCECGNCKIVSKEEMEKRK